jgi:hypothetical protein
MTNDDIFLDIFSEKNISGKSHDKCSENQLTNNKKLLLTSKNDDKMMTNDDANWTNNGYGKKFSCICGKDYKYRQGLFVHRKKCKYTKNIPEESLNEKQLILSILQQNNHLQNQIIELCKEKSITNINTNINSNNKTFNLNVFLNETCKDAMNIMDFVESIQLQLSDLEKVGKLGFINGISDIITSNLKALDVNKRPVHCTDKKREILYVKDENKWEKEEEDKKRLRKAIKKVVSKNQRLLPIYKEVHPDCGKSSSIYSDQYNKMIIESMGGLGNNDLEKEDKIIKKITKEVSIDKNLEIN